MDKLRQAAKDVVNVWDALTTDNLERIEPYIEALRQALAEPDTGIDRGAWADVPDATKWVDELRGDEPEPFGWLFKQADGDLYKLLRGEDAKWHEKNNPSWIKVSPLYTAPPKDVVEPVAWIVPDYGFLFPNEDSAQRYLDNIESNAAPTPLYTAPPKREWQGLTDEDIAEAVGSPIDEVYLNDFRKVEAKLRERNT